MANSNTILPAELQNLALKEPVKKTDKSLGQDDFLNLMLTQLQNQDPTNPMDSSNFMSQIAQFSTVNGITDLNSSFASLSSSLQSNQALQASTMVGSTVLVPGNKSELVAGGQVNGKVFLDGSTTNLVLNVSNAAGQTVKQIDLGTHESGLVPFTWDGLDNTGQPLPAGTYTIAANALVDNKAVAQTVLLNAKVNSVSLVSGGEPLLNLNGLGTYSMNDVLEIM